MNQIRQLIKPTPTIYHLKLSFPMHQNQVQTVIRRLQSFKPSPINVIFLSFTGIIHSPVHAHTLYHNIRHLQQKHQVPVYGFLEDRITALTYLAASATQRIIGNPFCVMGDLITPTKMYRNVRKLLNFLGVERERLGTKEKGLWDRFMQPTQHEREFTQKWLNCIEQSVVDTISERRSIPASAFSHLNSVLSPRSALSEKLIDEIGTAEEYKRQHFAKNKLVNEYFPLLGQSQHEQPVLTSQEAKILEDSLSLVSMPKVALMCMEDPTSKAIDQVVELVMARLEKGANLEGFDMAVGKMLESLQASLQNKDFITL